MTQAPTIKAIPWDTAALGVNAYEITALSAESLATAQNTPGHYSIRVDQLSSRQLLHEYGFYYCDTLIQPYCTPDRFQSFSDSAVEVSREADLEQLLGICRDAFTHDRFHRDFNISRDRADQRYNNWLKQLYREGKVYKLAYQGEPAGFIAIEKSHLVLHAIAETLRGKGLAKFLWTPACMMLFNQGYMELTSSVSASNLAIVNLYARLGFRFRNPVDIYHRLTR